MDFVPDQDTQPVQKTPFFDDVAASQGWHGHTTGRSIDRLRTEIVAALERLGARVVGFQRGRFTVGEQVRDGFRIRYVDDRSGQVLRGQLDVAALPVKTDWRLRKSLEKRRDQALRMALFMTREALDGIWYLQHLSPGYAPLMPWMIELQTGKTLSQLWNERSLARHLLPAGAGEGEIADAEFEEIS